MNRPSFGRRVAPQPAWPQAPAKPGAPATAAPDEVRVAADVPPVDCAASTEAELLAWKKQRTFTIPWKQICLIATLCFGLAAFVLPAGINRAVNWLLYVLTAMSFWIWFKGRRARAKA
jgi:hypothetical protein